MRSKLVSSRSFKRREAPVANPADTPSTQVRTTNEQRIPTTVAPTQRCDTHECRSIEWYSDGQARIVEVSDVRIEIRFVGRRGRRCRIAITAPQGAVFAAGDK